MQKFYILLCLLFFFNSVAWAKEAVIKLSIEEIQRLGLEANGLVLAARSQVNIAEAGVVSASAFPNPEVTFTAGPDTPRLPFELTGPSSMQRQVTVSQPLENPFLRSARIGSAEAGVEASRANLDQVRADLAAQLRVRAYELLLRRELAAMESSIFDLMEEIRRRIKLSVDVGESARFELIRADTEVMTAASRKEAALLSAERARVTLFQLTAGALPPDFEIVAFLNDPVDLPTLEELHEQIVITNPDILRLQAEQDRARLRIDQERASVLPSVNILYSNYQDRQFTSNTAGLSVRVPLFYRRRGEIDSAIFDSARVRETLEYRRYEVNRLLESAWQAMQIAKRRVEMYEGGIIQEAESALRVAEAAFRLGERGFIEVLDTQRVLRGARAELLQAYFELQSAAAEIDRLRAHYPKE
ncbi:TolC family protein [Nitrosomonas communis]|uniref:TolC family protein n=1 Tax=Nitrosomonas communis TaxID=44574 RepID=UPI0026EFFA86|nr:TolC family protein [Nitrosomonas communis]MCO6428798.1 TolC family protein [Nitrosomonas communis]